MKKLFVAAALLTASAQADQEVDIVATVNGEEVIEHVHISDAVPTQSVCMETADYKIEGTVSLDQEGKEVVTDLQITDENGTVVATPCLHRKAHGNSQSLVASQETVNGNEQEVAVGVSVVETEAEIASGDEQAA